MSDPASNPAGSGDLSVGSKRPSAPSNNSSDENQETENIAAAAKRARGRPPGSKNKPKPPTFVPVNAASNVSVHLLEVPSGADVCSRIVEYARVHRSGVAVLHAVGSVAGAISLRNFGPFKGQFDIVALRGTIIPDYTNGAPSSMTLVISPGGAGNVVGGIVNGPLIAAGPVIVTAGMFSLSAIERLPSDLPKMENSDLDPVYADPVSASGYSPVYNNTNMNLGHWLSGG